MLFRPRCLDWDYESHADRSRLLPAAAAGVLDDLWAGLIDIPRALRDTRSIHARLFTGLTPTGQEYLAGNYRGEKFPCLKNRTATIGANPLVGFPPQIVRTEMMNFAQVIDALVTAVDQHNAEPDDQVSPTEKLSRVVQGACTIFSHFLLVHPYANGNGHVGRFMLHAFLWPRAGWRP